MLWNRQVVFTAVGPCSVAALSLLTESNAKDIWVRTGHHLKVIHGHNLGHKLKFNIDQLFINIKHFSFKLQIKYYAQESIL